MGYSYPDSEQADLTVRKQQARDAEEKKVALHKRRGREWRVLLPVLVLALLAWPNFGVAKVQGHSMEPRYHTGDSLYLLRTYRYFSPLHPGDVIVIKLRHGQAAGEQIVKRVMFVQNKAGTAKWPTYLPTSQKNVRSVNWFAPQVTGREPVPPGSVIVMGDNIMNSMDSRDFGPVFQSEIIGKVLNP